MAEAARRMDNGLGADVARRLIARPIRLQGTQAARTIPSDGAPFAEPTAIPDAPSETTGRLQAEILMMKAIVKAQRHENETLRAAFGVHEEPLGDEARAVRERWAGLIDSLLTVSR